MVINHGSFFSLRFHGERISFLTNSQFNLDYRGLCSSTIWRMIVLWMTLSPVEFSSMVVLHIDLPSSQVAEAAYDYDKPELYLSWPNWVWRHQKTSHKTVFGLIICCYPRTRHSPSSFSLLFSAALLLEDSCWAGINCCTYLSMQNYWMSIHYQISHIALTTFGYPLPSSSHILPYCTQITILLQFATKKLSIVASQSWME